MRIGSSCTSGEGIENWGIGLPSVQEELARRIDETGTPAVLMHTDSMPLCSGYIAEHYPVIVENCSPARPVQALADVLLRD